VSGMRIVVSRPLQTGLPVTVQLQLPADSLDAYSRQPPVTVEADVRWQREEDGRRLCGLEFRNPTQAQRDRIGQVFAFYNKAPDYVR
ncbi:MAG: PilZ domain-containing protein, partial [Rhodocyclaceae bacterium]|nr:PilZ domain-containing protein [Rhodocyclaceae bacterium]